MSGSWEEIAPVMFDERRWGEAAGEAAAAVALADVKPGAAVLDVACGPGRHVLELAALGYSATGVDITPSFVETGRALAAERSLQSSAELVCEDMRTFVREGAFDAAFVFSTSFGYFEDAADDVTALRNIRASLKDGGALVMELVGKEVLARTLRPPTWAKEGGVLLLSEQRVRDDWAWADHYMAFLSDEGRQEFVLSHRLYSAVELKFALAVAGFTSVQCFGGFDGSPYGPVAEALVAVAR
ncbi:MAG TPA: class I SAM-dependent methyltransferase [Acidimicrobiales bacterium]|jgi:SAM-dependent methyltransferase